MLSVKNDKAMHAFREKVEQVCKSAVANLVVTDEHVWSMRCMLANGLAVPISDVNDEKLAEFIGDVLADKLEQIKLRVVIEEIKGHHTLRFLRKS